MFRLKVRAVGSSSGVVLPKELLAQMGLKQGDVVYATKAADGAFRLTPFDERFEQQMAVADDVAGEYRDVFRVLAKR